MPAAPISRTVAHTSAPRVGAVSSGPKSGRLAPPVELGDGRRPRRAERRRGTRPAPREGPREEIPSRTKTRRPRPAPQATCAGRRRPTRPARARRSGRDALVEHARRGRRRRRRAPSASCSRDVGERGEGSITPAFTVPALATTATGSGPRAGRPRARGKARVEPPVRIGSTADGQRDRARARARPMDDVVRLGRRVHARRRRGGGPSPPASRPKLVGVLARRAEPDQVRSRAARHEQALPLGGQLEKLGEPAQRDGLEEVVGLHAAAACAGDGRGERCGGTGRRRLVRPSPRSRARRAGSRAGRRSGPASTTTSRPAPSCGAARRAAPGRRSRSSAPRSWSGRSGNCSSDGSPSRSTASARRSVSAASCWSRTSPSTRPCYRRPGGGRVSERTPTGNTGTDGRHPRGRSAVAPARSRRELVPRTARGRRLGRARGRAAPAAGAAAAGRRAAADERAGAPDGLAAWTRACRPASLRSSAWPPSSSASPACSPRSRRSPRTRRRTSTSASTRASARSPRGSSSASSSTRARSTAASRRRVRSSAAGRCSPARCCPACGLPSRSQPARCSRWC